MKMLLLGIVVAVCGCCIGCRTADSTPDPDAVVLHEGLPHQFWERELLARERANKPFEEIRGFPFYRELLTMAARDARRLTDVLGRAESFVVYEDDAPLDWDDLMFVARPTYIRHKWCGGFHPDYAVEWGRGEDRRISLICLGCFEVRTYGRQATGRSSGDLTNSARQELATLLKPYRRNRPK